MVVASVDLWGFSGSVPGVWWSLLWICGVFLDLYLVYGGRFCGSVGSFWICTWGMVVASVDLWGFYGSVPGVWWSLLWICAFVLDLHLGYGGRFCGSVPLFWICTWVVHVLLSHSVTLATHYVQLTAAVAFVSEW